MKLMKMVTFIFCVFLTNLDAAIEKPIDTTSPETSYDQEMANEQMIHFLEGFRSYFESMYAPIEWKQESLGWDLDFEFENAKEDVFTNNLNMIDFRKVIKHIADSTHDWHVGVSFYSTEAAFLPFEVKKVSDKYYITYLASESTGLKLGDEIVSFGDRSIVEAIDEIKLANLYNRKTEREQSKAEVFLTLRLGVRGDEVPKGSIKIGVIHRGESEEKVYALTWYYFSELIKKDTDLSLMTKDLTFGNDFSPRDMTDPLFKQIQEREEFVRIYGGEKEFEHKMRFSIQEHHNPNALGTRKSFLPDLGNKIWASEAYFPWETDGYFHAYIYKNARGKKIGTIRIADYSPTNLKEAVAEFQSLIDRMESRTDALIIDQLNNPGGYAEYAFGLLSMLTSHALEMPKDRVKITAEDVIYAHQFLRKYKKIDSNYTATGMLGTDFYGIHVNLDLVKRMCAYYQFLIDQWEMGKNLTDPIPYLCIDKLQPHPQHRYTKPILFLINGLSMSCGDFVPAILQDNKRAHLFGSVTGGAGGSVISFKVPNKYGIATVRMTNSISERPSLEKIENRGVQPDTAYVLTEKDILFNYIDKMDAINAAVDSLIDSK